MEKTINIKVLNELLNVSTNHKYFLNEEKGYQGIGNNYDGQEGEYNETFKYYQHPDLKDVFLRITYTTDSYGSNESITEVQFVEGVKKTITVFEPIK